MNKTKLFLASLVMATGTALENHLKACEFNPDHTDVPIGGCSVEIGNPNNTFLCYIGRTGDPCTGS